MSEQNRIVSPALAQFEAQGQLQGQAELQGQAQGQLEAQAQGQGQAELQGQAQGQAELQGQAQGQAQYSSNEADNSASNSLESHSGNLNLNGNGNLNGNVNYSEVENELDNDVDNEVENEVENKVENDVDTDVETTVTTTVDVEVSGDFGPPTETSVLHMDELDIDDLDGSFIVMPDFSTQTLTGDGNIFNLSQVNSLVDEDSLHGASVSLDIGGGGGFPDFGSLSIVPGDSGGPNFTFSQIATATGGTATNTSEIGTDGTATGTAGAANSLNQEAFTQHIVMGANIQYNTMPISVVGGDSISDATVGE